MTLTLVAPPASSDLKKSMKPRLLGADFGDGYGETAPDGINTMLMVLQVAWKDISFTDADAIDAFLTARGGSERFLWTKPRELAPRLWRCKAWEVSDGRTLSDVTATFEEQPA